MKRAILAFLCASIVATATAHAGTTGVVDGSVIGDNGAPIADVHVVAISPSDRETATTDQQGHFAFLRLAPDNYTVSLEKNGYEPTSYAGVTVFADNIANLKFRLQKELAFHCGLHTYNASDLVNFRAGSDVYNVFVTKYSIFPNDVTMGLSTVPGITFGNGGPIPH